MTIQQSKLLNGNITIDELEGKISIRNQQMEISQVNHLTATMLEVEGVKWKYRYKRDGAILDSIIETVNGTVTVGATPENLSVSLVNGDVRGLTIKEDRLKKSRQAL